MSAEQSDLPISYRACDAAVGFHYWLFLASIGLIVMGRVIDSGRGHAKGAVGICRSEYRDGRFITVTLSLDYVDKGHLLYPAEDIDGSLIPSPFTSSMRSAGPASPPPSLYAEGRPLASATLAADTARYDDQRSMAEQLFTNITWPDARAALGSPGRHSQVLADVLNYLRQEATATDYYDLDR